MYGIALLLVLSSLGGCGFLPGSQASITGRVLGESAAAREAGRAETVTVPGAAVTCDGSAASTSSDGTFQLHLSAAGQYKCSVSAPGYTTFTATLAGTAGKALNVTFSVVGPSACESTGPSAFICPALRLAPGTLTGTVTNPQTDSVAKNTQVECWDLNQSTWVAGQPPLGAIATTDQFGRYILTLPVDPYACLANHDDPLYRVAVAPATTTSADMETCGQLCPSFGYHNGDVMHSYTAYVIFWLPSGATFEPGNHNDRFESLVQRYFRDIGGTPFFAILTQYWDKSGPISGAATLGGTYVDTTPYPHAGTRASPLYDSDIRAAIDRAIQANGWSNDSTHEFFVITGYGIQECESANQGASCTYSGGGNGYCGYHSMLGIFNQDATFAYIADNAVCATLPSFGQHPSPNHDPVADGELSTISHEQFEAISDPNDGGWYDGDPYTGEMGDKCVTDYGTIHSNGSNVTLGGNPYILQAEWSNAASSCAFAYTP